MTALLTAPCHGCHRTVTVDRMGSQVREMRARRTAGESAAALAKVYGLHVATVRQIVRGDRWKSLDRAVVA